MKTNKKTATGDKRALAGKTILVTGGAGFIGSNFIHFILDQYQDVRIVNLDKLTYAGNPSNLADLAGDSRYVFAQGDIGDSELVARLRALVRRGNEPKAQLLRLADLTLDTLTRQARRGETTLDLAAREYRLLEFLMRSAGRVCGRMTILEKVWDYNFDPGTNIVDVYVRRLREKIDAGFEHKLLHTVRGAGYVLKEEK